MSNVGPNAGFTIRELMKPTNGYKRETGNVTILLGKKKSGKGKMYLRLKLNRNYLI